MKLKIFISIAAVLCVTGITRADYFPQDFDRAAFYNILKSGNIGDIDKEIAIIEASSVIEKEAYHGTLLMKKAGLVKKAKDKLDYFKKGRIKLETELNKNNSKAEYHFLRLIIQEHAPKVTKYRSQIDDDAEYVKQHYKELLPSVQQVVLDYSKTSNKIHTSDL
ncbi:MAG: hypothetical protein ABJA78_02385 [Ferruginibacter sp.]